MQLDCAAYWADVVQVEFIERIRPEEYKRFDEVRKRVDLEANLSKPSDTRFPLTPEHLSFLAVTSHKEIKKAYHSLRDAFKEHTNMSLFIDWHDSEEYGSSQDGVGGEFWYVDGAYTLSPAGERYKDEITRETYIVQGD